jgi:uncharacterized protein YdeI (YjbR/CyaY-like superfamily)
MPPANSQPAGLARLRFTPMKGSSPDVIFFSKPEKLRDWFQRHHSSEPEVWVGFHKKHTGTRSITWPESVDEALCFGWIDGIRKSIDADRYKIRFTPRRRGSIWSAVNIRRIEALAKEKRMHAAGLAAFSLRRENKSGIYSYEQRSEQLPDPYAARLRRHKKAWEFFQAQPPSYRKAIAWWIVSAKKEETRDKRLLRLISESAVGRRLR